MPSLGEIASVDLKRYYRSTHPLYLTPILSDTSPFKSILKWATLVVLAMLLGVVIAKFEMTATAILVALPLLAVAIWAFVKWPKLGIYSLVFMGFATSALSRYFPGIPYGLSVDLLLVITFLILFIRDFKKLELGLANRDLTWLWVVWMLFCIITIFNPLSPGLEAWFYAVRGIGIYPLLMIPLALMIFKTPKEFTNLFIFIVALEVIGSLWAIKQIHIGVSATENRWLLAGAANTHVLFGKLRAFSYFSDAAQFGASQIHIAFMCFIYALVLKKRVQIVLMVLAGVLCFYGFILTGSRGPLVIPVVAGFLFLILSKQTKLFLTGLTFGILVFSFLKFTSIGQSNYNIARLRTALNPTEDASFLVRKDREKKVAQYLADKPIGGGIGSAGFWGKRFKPGSFLAEIGTDGHYTRIWMETGIIGLILYIFILGWISIKALIIAFRLKNKRLRLMVSAWAAGFVGVCVASYTNGLLVQMPTGAITYCGLAFIWLAPQWDTKTELGHQEPNSETIPPNS